MLYMKPILEFLSFNRESQLIHVCCYISIMSFFCLFNDLCLLCFLVSFIFVKLMVFLDSFFSFHKMEIQPHNYVLLEGTFTFLDNICDF